MSTTFQREANTLLKDAGYRYERTSGNAHEVWVKARFPDIHVPGTPSGGRDAMMARLRRAIRKGTPLTPPSGQEIDMAKAPKSTDKTLSEKLVALATPPMLKKAAVRQKRREEGKTGRSPVDMAHPTEVANWVRRCIETHGAIPNAEFRAAAETLEIPEPELSLARKTAGAASFWLPGETNKDARTDFVGRLPANAKRSGVQKAPFAPAPKLPEPPKSAPKPEPTPPAAPAPVPPSREVEEHHVAVQSEQSHEPATNGRLSELELAMQMVRDAALAETHALAEEDIRSLEGLQETLRRHASESQGMVGQITLILKRVNSRERVAAPA